jgi:hypothetical protein
MKLDNHRFAPPQRLFVQVDKTGLGALNVAH